MRILRRMYEASVFKPIHINRSLPASSILAMLFHRSAATLYLIYGLWAVAAISGQLYSLPDDFFQTIFALLILLCSIPACIGATFFPRYGRMELYGAAALVSLIVVYMGILFMSALGGSSLAVSQLILILSVVVVPVARAVYVYLTLVGSTEGR